MIPEAAHDMQEFTIASPPSKTWRVDFEKRIVSGTIDDIDAVRQAAYLILSTPRYHYLIYDRSYGSELNTLIHKHPAVAVSEAKRMIEEALLQDDRINEVKNYNISIDRGIAVISCTVDSTYGEFNLKKEVEL